MLTFILKMCTNGSTSQSFIRRFPLGMVLVPDDFPYDPMPARQPQKPDKEMREIDSHDLMQGHREIVIRHGQEAYRLSVTRAGKLILRK